MIIICIEYHVVQIRSWTVGSFFIEQNQFFLALQTVDYFIVDPSVDVSRMKHSV